MCWTKTHFVEYDKLDPSTQTKDFYHKEAAANLNAAANASAALGAGLEEQPVTLIMGRGMHRISNYDLLLIYYSDTSPRNWSA